MTYFFVLVKIRHNINRVLVRSNASLVINQMKSRKELNQRLMEFLYGTALQVGGGNNDLFEYLDYEYRVSLLFMVKLCYEENI
jgi:hypothetical protein